MKVFIVSMYCPDDNEDGTPIMGVYSTRKQAEAQVASLAADDIESLIEEWAVDAVR